MSDLSGTQRLFFFSLIIMVLSVSVGYWTGGLTFTLILTLAMLGFLTITKSVWLPKVYGKTLIRRMSLWLVYATAMTFSFWNSFVNTLVIQPLLIFLKENNLIEKDYLLPLGAPAVSVMVFVLIAVFIINYFMRDKTVMGIHPNSIDLEFPEKEYTQRLLSFCRILKDDLNKTDNETNWSAELFTPLDAEVEIQTGNKKHKKITELIQALKSDKQSKVFLVLGDPGSGKSVSLRKLCRDLLTEVSQTKRVPIYVNLKEWVLASRWDEGNPPTTQALYDFILQNLKGRLDVFGNEFIDHYYRKMFEHGRLFLVLDSFDEIPSVLDEDDSSWLIHELSAVIYQFLAGAHESRGILASRIFRKPTSKFQTSTTYEIHPFSDHKIVQTLKNSISFDQKLTQELFTNRQELIPIARNPFTAALISSYAKDNDNSLPQKQADLYINYIAKRLDSCTERLNKNNLTKQDVINCCSDIATLMFKNEHYGLEAPVKELETHLPQHQVAKIISILKYARLGRVGGGDAEIFSFVHRRFNEYFVALMLNHDVQLLSLESIPSDSRWRDALVMYCELLTRIKQQR